MPTIVTTATKTANSTLVPITTCTSGSVTIGSAVDVSTKLGSLQYFIKIGRTAATALTAQVLFRLEASLELSGNDDWYPIYQFSSSNATTAAASTTLSGATTAGNTTAVLTSATGFSAGSIVYEKESTLANSEWSRVKSVSSNTITFEEAQTRNHTSGINVATIGEIITGQVDITGLVRIRLVVDCASNATTTAVDVVAGYTSLDSAASN